MKDGITLERIDSPGEPSFVRVSAIESGHEVASTLGHFKYELDIKGDASMVFDSLAVFRVPVTNK